MEGVNPTLIVALLALLGSLLAAGLQFWGAFVTARPGSDNAIYQGFRALVDGLQSRVNGLEEKVNACEERHEECETNLAAIRRELDAYLRANEPAAYRPGDLQRPVDPRKKR